MINLAAGIVRMVLFFMKMAERMRLIRQGKKEQVHENMVAWKERVDRARRAGDAARSDPTRLPKHRRD